MNFKKILAYISILLICLSGFGTFTGYDTISNVVSAESYSNDLKYIINKRRDLIMAIETCITVGLIVGLIGLIWSGFKVTLGRMQIKELWWDTLSKWIIYILLMASWGPLTTGIANFANNISSDVGVSSLNMNKNIVSLKDKINKLRFDENQNLANKMKEIAKGVVVVDLPDYAGGDSLHHTDIVLCSVPFAE